MESRRTQAERASDARRRLIEAAITLLAERGYAGTSFAAIGQQAGMSRGLVTHHFGSKEQCVAEVIAWIRRSILERLADAGELRGIAALDHLLRLYLSDEGDMREASRAMYVIITHAATAGPDLLPAVAENNRELRALIARLLTQAIEQDEIPADSDVTALALAITGVMRGVLIQLMMDTELSSADATEAAVALVGQALAGALAPAP